MSPLAQSFRTAAGALREISERAPGERGRRASAGALVLRAVEGAMIPGARGANFLGRRAEAEVMALPGSPERASLRRLLALLGRGTGPRSERLANGLVGYACELERTRRLAEADAALALALSLAPLDAEIALHAGRVARKLGERERALDLYCAARALDEAAGAVARLAAVGEAVISPQPAVALGRVIRAALSSGDGEAAAVGLEERGRARRAIGAHRSAARDLCLAAARFTDAVDRARVAHALADVAIGAGNPLAAREALLAALAWGDPPQREHARARLHTLSLDLGDRVGARRWRVARPPALTSLSLYPGAGVAFWGAEVASSGAERLARWREALDRRSE